MLKITHNASLNRGNEWIDASYVTNVTKYKYHKLQKKQYAIQKSIFKL